MVLETVYSVIYINFRTQLRICTTISNGSTNRPFFVQIEENFGFADETLTIVGITISQLATKPYLSFRSCGRQNDK